MADNSVTRPCSLTGIATNVPGGSRGMLLVTTLLAQRAWHCPPATCRSLVWLHGKVLTIPPSTAKPLLTYVKSFSSVSRSVYFATTVDLVACMSYVTWFYLGALPSLSCVVVDSAPCMLYPRLFSLMTKCSVYTGLSISQVTFMGRRSRSQPFSFVGVVSTLVNRSCYVSTWQPSLLTLIVLYFILFITLFLCSSLPSVIPSERQSLYDN